MCTCTCTVQVHKHIRVNMCTLTYTPWIIDSFIPGNRANLKQIQSLLWWLVDQTLLLSLRYVQEHEVRICVAVCHHKKTIASRLHPMLQHTCITWLNSSLSQTLETASFGLETRPHRARNGVCVSWSDRGGTGANLSFTMILAGTLRIHWYTCIQNMDTRRSYTETLWRDELHLCVVSMAFAPPIIHYVMLSH